MCPRNMNVLLMSPYFLDLMIPFWSGLVWFGRSIDCAILDVNGMEIPHEMFVSSKHNCLSQHGRSHL